jgi:hypothetical protein
MSTPLDLDKLMELAEKATPGRWHADGPYTGSVFAEGQSSWVLGDGRQADAEYVAACSPDAIRELVGRCKRYEEALTPSGDTKAAYHGEFLMDSSTIDNAGRYTEAEARSITSTALTMHDGGPEQVMVPAPEALSTARREHAEVVAERDEAREKIRGVSEAMLPFLLELASKGKTGILSTEAVPMLVADRDLLRARVEELEKALAWYGEQARLCRLIHSEGDAGRNALAADGGARARVALPPDPATSGGEPSVETRYWELIYAVGKKWPNESRHETALRYIRQAEDHPLDATSGAKQAEPQPERGGGA